MAKYEFKVGDKIIMLKDCGYYLKEGEVCVVQKGTADKQCMDQLFAYSENGVERGKGCNCQHKWKLAKEVQKEAPEFKAGDRVRATIDCTPIKKGGEYVVQTGGEITAKLYLTKDNKPCKPGNRCICTCENTWELIPEEQEEETEDSAPFKVGDEVSEAESGGLTVENLECAARTLAGREFKIIMKPGRIFSSWAYITAPLVNTNRSHTWKSENFQIRVKRKKEYLECLEWFQKQGVKWREGEEAMSHTTYVHGIATHPVYYSDRPRLQQLNRNIDGFTSYTFKQFKNKFINPLTPKTMGEESMSLIDKVALTFKSEPQKSFQKTGITDKEDTLTAEGEHVFMHYLLKKFGDEFKKEVADPILKTKKGKK